MPSLKPLPRQSLQAETGALKKFGANVRARRDARDLSQEKMAILNPSQHMNRQFQSSLETIPAIEK